MFRLLGQGVTAPVHGPDVVALEPMGRGVPRTPSRAGSLLRTRPHGTLTQMVGAALVAALDVSRSDNEFQVTPRSHRHRI